MSSDLDTILRRVAAGELTPQEALPLIDAAQAASAPSSTPSSDAPSTSSSVDAPEWGTPGDRPPGSPGAPEAPVPAGSGRATSVRLAVAYRSLTVIADPEVSEVSVIGPHSVRRDGDVLVVESLTLPGIEEPTSAAGGTGTFAFASLPRSIAWARALKEQHVTVRVNPLLSLDVDAAASAVRISGCEGGARLRVVASSLKVERLRGRLDLDALTSSVKGTVAVTGASHLAAESSSIKLGVLPGSDVAVTANNRLSKIVVPGAVSKPGKHTPQQVTATIGGGAGTLAIDAVMSSVVLAADEWSSWATGWKTA